VNRQIGVRDFKYVGKIPPPRTHRSGDTAHEHWLQTHCQWYPMGDVITHNSRTVSRRIFKLGGGIDHVTRHAWPLIKVKRSKVKVTRSHNISPAITLYLGNRWYYQLKTWWKLSARGARHMTHFHG